jgi:hypothetical protein
MPVFVFEDGRHAWNMSHKEAQEKEAARSHKEAQEAQEAQNLLVKWENSFAFCASLWLLLCFFVANSSLLLR